jgi:hypothetical protein
MIRLALFSSSTSCITPLRQTCTSSAYIQNSKSFLLSSIEFENPSINYTCNAVFQIWTFPKPSTFSSWHEVFNQGCISIYQKCKYLSCDLYIITSKINLQINRYSLLYNEYTNFKIILFLKSNILRDAKTYVTDVLAMLLDVLVQEA